MHDPVWSTSEGVLLGLTDRDRVEKVDPAGSTARSTLSGRLPDVGENISTSPTDRDVVYVPQPELGRVAVIGIGDLRQVGSLSAGPAPSYVDDDSGSKVLMAISADGSTVTGVDLVDGAEVVTSKQVRRGREADVDGGKRGRRIDFYVTGPEGVAYYKGDPLAVQKIGELPVPAGEAAGDLVKSSRTYVAEPGTGHLVAVDEQRRLHGLETVGQADLGEPIRFLGVDETRIYAVTEHALVVLQTNSFEGYADDTIPVVERVEFRRSLPDEAFRDAPVSGLTVGRDRVYLALEGQPYLVSVAKPDL